MPNRENHPAARPTPSPNPETTLAGLLTRNPHLTLADILALWHWIGPSSLVH